NFTRPSVRPSVRLPLPICPAAQRRRRGRGRGAAAAFPTTCLRSLIGAGRAGVFCTTAPGPPWAAARSTPPGDRASGGGQPGGRAPGRREGEGGEGRGGARRGAGATLAGAGPRRGRGVRGAGVGRGAGPGVRRGGAGRVSARPVQRRRPPAPRPPLPNTDQQETRPTPPPAPPSRGAAQPALSRRPAGRTGAARARPLFQTNCVAKVSFRWREETVSPALPPLPRHPPPARRGTAGTPRAGAGAAAAAGPGEGRGGTSQGPALLPPPAPRPPPRSVPPAPRVHRGLMAVGTAGPRSPARPERRRLPAPAEGGAARPVGAGRAERGTAPGPRSAAFIWGRRGAPRSSRSSPAAVQPLSPPRPGTRRPAGKETGPFRISSKRPPPI
ncbi:translation initiation factor IF-2-like, partial [Falco cherrug]|uniref:translation initiation factor IF-2-like n=1 Tax=Falco cherrug TaxID=345164 RepID=UPI002478AACB